MPQPIVISLTLYIFTSGYGHHQWLVVQLLFIEGLSLVDDLVYWKFRCLGVVF